MSSARFLRIKQTEGTLSVMLARPEKTNALNAAIVDELSDVISKAGATDTRLLVLAGEGRNFSAGVDFSSLDEESDGDLLLRFVRIEQLLQKISQSPFETAAFAHGRNFGAGADLFFACNRRFAAPDSTFRMPGLRFGLVLGTGRLAEIVGVGEARSILWSNEVIGTERALKLGLIEEVVDQAEWPLIAEHIAAAGRDLSSRAIRTLCDRTGRKDQTMELCHLVQSASAPGLKERMRAYFAAQQAR